MSLIQRVALVIEDLGEGNLDDVCREIGWEVSRRQVMKALHNARFTGLLESDGRKPPINGTPFARPTTYRPAKRKDWRYEAAQRPPTCVWDLGLML